MKQILFLIIAMGLTACATNQKVEHQNVMTALEELRDHVKELREGQMMMMLKIEELQNPEDENFRTGIQEIVPKEDCGCNDSLTEEEVQKEIEKEDSINKEEIPSIKTQERMEEEEIVPAPRPDDGLGEINLEKKDVTSEEIK